MSGSRPSNVVPMNQAASPMSTPPMPNPMWWGGGAPLPGCGPGGGAGLAECYWQVQAATAFISAIMIDAINNNPDVTQAIIDAITKSGSNLPLLGVTNGSDAQPGQVGELVQYIKDPIPILASAQDQNVTMGTLQPGDWDCWAIVGLYVPVGSVFCVINPIPPGMSGSGLQGEEGAVAGPSGGQELTTLSLPYARISTAVPVLINFRLITNSLGAGTAGNLNLVFCARRRR